MCPLASAIPRLIYLVLLETELERGVQLLLVTALGLVEGPTKLTITPKFQEIRADQFESPIDGALTTSDAEMDIVMMEFDPLTFQRWFTADTVTNPQLLANSRVLQFGGQFTDQTSLRTMMIVSPDRTNIGQWIYAFMYRVYLKSAIPLMFHRTATSKYATKWGAVADFTRQPGDELLCIARTRSNNIFTYGPYSVTSP